MWLCTIVFLYLRRRLPSLMGRLGHPEVAGSARRESNGGWRREIMPKNTGPY